MKERIATTVKDIIIQVGSRFISMVHPFENRRRTHSALRGRIWPNGFILLIAMNGIRATCLAYSRSETEARA
jgi:hypothetical protein